MTTTVNFESVFGYSYTHAFIVDGETYGAPIHSVTMSITPDSYTCIGHVNTHIQYVDDGVLYPLRTSIN